MKQELAWADYTQLQTMQIKLHILTITYNVLAAFPAPR